MRNPRPAQFVASAPGGKALFGPHPIPFGIPAAAGPLCFDMATSAIALFGVLTSKAKGEPLPPNVEKIPMSLFLLFR